jgi:PAS domain S-box-containing protein
MSRIGPAPLNRSTRRTQLLAGVTGGIALLALVGWVSDLRFLAGQWGEYIPMAPTTAIAFLFLVGAQLCIVRFPGLRLSRLFALSALSIVSLMCLVMIAKFFAVIDLGVEQLLSRTNEMLQGIPVGRMSPLTAISFLLLAASLLLSLIAQRWRHTPTTAALLATGATTLNAVVLVGYIYGVPLMYGSSLVPTAWTTALAFVLMGAGQMDLQGRSIQKVRAWSRDTLRGKLLRAFLPLIVIYIFVEGWVDLRMELSGRLLHPALWQAITALVASGSLLLVIGWIARRTGDSIDQTQAALSESEERFRKLYEFAPVGISLVDRNGKFIRCNPALENMVGYSEKELRTMSFNDITHSDDKEMGREALSDLITGKQTVAQIEKRYKRKDGTLVWVLITVSGVYDDDGSLLYNISVTQDITERKLAEAHIKRLSRVYAVLSDINQAIVRVHEPQLLFNEVCRIAVEVGNFPMAWIGKVNLEKQSVDILSSAGIASDFLTKVKIDLADKQQSQRPAVRAITTSMKDISNDIKHEPTMQPWQKDALALGFRSSAAFPLKVFGKVWGVFVLFSDEVGIFNSDEVKLLDELTLDIAFAIEFIQQDLDRKQSEAVLRLNSAALNAAANAIMITDRDGAIQSVNSAFTALTGYTAEAALGKNPRELVKSGVHDPTFYKAMWDTILSGNVWQGEITNRRKDGTLYDEEQSITPLRDEQGQITHFIAIKQDVSERKRAVESLRESERRYREMFEESLAGHYISTVAGKLLACNEVFAKIHGYTSTAHALQASDVDFHFAPELRKKFLDRIRREKKLEHHEYRARKLDGSFIDIIENVRGRFDERGELVELQGYVIDNTEQRKLEEGLRQAQKMESIGTLAGGIAHDFNNVLGIILAYASTLGKPINAGEKEKKNIETIIKATHRGAALVRQILTFARKTEAVLESIRLNDEVLEAANLLKETLPKNIEVKLFLEPQLPTITGDRTQINQTILNLAINARDAMPHGGSVTFTTATVAGAEAATKLLNGYLESYVVLRVQDTGTGMDEATRKRIFEPFYTTKEKGKGTGLGLAVVYGIMKAYGGGVHVESTPGVGTTFELFFPVPPPSIEPELNSANTTKQGLAGTETVLFVEDEELLTEQARSVFEGAGYRVHTAMDGGEAVRIYTERALTIGLVITDLGLPKLDGSALIQTLKQLNPTVKIIVTSGYFEPRQRAMLKESGVNGFLQKPYETKDLLLLARSVLDKK